MCMCIFARAILCTLHHFFACTQADHELAVAEGGGACGLGNLRTLCTPCHQRETAALRQRLKRRADARAAQASRRRP